LLITLGIKLKMNDIWNEITLCLQQNLSDSGFQTFLSSAKAISYNNNVLNLETPNLFSRNWIKEKCEPILKEAFLNTTYNPLMISYILSSETSLNEGSSRLDSQILISQKKARILLIQNIHLITLLWVTIIVLRMLHLRL
jgi:chromosomal replication initiation ATPase DnaA